MATMTPETWDFINRYSREVFGAQDEHLAGLMDEAVAAGLPEIAVGPDVGRLLKILTSMTEGRLAVEVGTLGGYSGIWITRGLRPDGRLITIEYEPFHAQFAGEQLQSPVAAALGRVTASQLDQALLDIPLDLDLAGSGGLWSGMEGRQQPLGDEAFAHALDGPEAGAQGVDDALVGLG